MSLPVLYHDPWLVAFDKPSGLLSVPGKGAQKQDSLATRVQAEFPGALNVHRLDRDTSGVIVMALDAETHRRLSWQFESRAVQKQYLAVVDGCVTADEGEIDAPLAKDFDHPPRHRVDPVHGRPAQTRWQVLAREADRTRLLLLPRTGRSHQLRVHLAHVGHSVLGDPLYAHPAALAAADRLMLHASRLEFSHPMTGEPLVIVSTCPF